MNKICTKTLTCAAASLMAASSAFAADGTWTLLSSGNASGSWGTATNWSGSTIASGTDAIANFTTLNITANSTITLDGSRNVGTLNFTDATTASNDWILNAGTGGSLILDSAGAAGTINVTNRTLTINANIIGADTEGLTKAGAGTLVLGGTNTYAGITTVNGGTLQATKTAALAGYNTPAQVVVNNGGTLAVSVGGAGQWLSADIDILRANATFNTGSALGIDTTGASLSYGSNLGGNAGLTKLGTNTLTLTGTNTYAGVTTVSAGTLTVNGDQTAATGGWSINGTSTTVNFNTNIVLGTGKTISFANGNGDNTRILNVAATVTTSTTSGLNVGGGNTINLNSGAAWTQNGSLQIQPASTFADAVLNVNSGASFTYAGSTTIKLTASSGSNGGDSFLKLNGGTFTTGQGFDNNSSGSAGTANLVFSNGGTLKLSASITNLVSGASTQPFNVQVGTGGGIINTNGNSTSLARGITDVTGQTGSLTKDGAGTLTLSGVNTFTGSTSVANGTLALADNAGLKFVIGASGTNNAITGAGTLNLDGDFTFDLTAAATAGSWQIVDNSTLTETYSSTFSVVGFTDNGNNTWSTSANGTTYTFSEATGALSAVPEPGAALLGGLGLMALLRRRRA